LRCCCLPAFQCVDANHADRICGECPDHCAWGAAQVDQSRTRISRRGTSFALSLLSNNKISRIACFGEFRVAFPCFKEWNRFCFQQSVYWAIQ
jgi:hypothetical protein